MLFLKCWNIADALLGNYYWAWPDTCIGHNRCKMAFSIKHSVGYGPGCMLHRDLVWYKWTLPRTILKTWGTEARVASWLWSCSVPVVIAEMQFTTFLFHKKNWSCGGRCWHYLHWRLLVRKSHRAINSNSDKEYNQPTGRGFKMSNQWLNHRGMGHKLICFFDPKHIQKLHILVRS